VFALAEEMFSVPSIDVVHLLGDDDIEASIRASDHTLAPLDFFESGAFQATLKEAGLHEHLDTQFPLRQDYLRSSEQAAPAQVDGDESALGNLEILQPADTAGAGARKGSGAGRTNYYASKPVREFMHSLTHNWAKDGTHVGFRKGEDVVREIENALGIAVSSSSAYDYVKKEKDMYKQKLAGEAMEKRDDCLPHMIRPNLAALIAEASSAAKLPTKSSAPRSDIGDDELAAVTQSRHGRPPILSAVNFPALKEQILKVSTSPAFCVALVQCLIAIHHRKTLNLEPGEESASWYPSETFVLQFLHKELNMSFRKITAMQAMITPEAAEKKARLHQLNIERLGALLRDNVVLPENIVFSDETALWYFPKTVGIWAPTGSKDAVSQLKEDKRNFTGDFAVDGNGEIVKIHVIFQGKTTRSLPPAEILAKYNNMLITNRENHWCDLEKKIGFAQELQRTLIARHALKKNITIEEAKQNMAWVWFLDCWPVNLSAAFKAAMVLHCPQLQILYLPAGATNEYQVGDLAIHKQIKDFIRQRANAWYFKKVSALQIQLDTEKINQTQFVASVTGLMQTQLLRVNVLGWINSSVEQIQQPVEGDALQRNVIQRCIDKVYLGPARSPEMLSTIAEKEAAEKKKVEQLRQRAIVTRTMALTSANAVAGIEMTDDEFFESVTATLVLDLAEAHNDYERVKLLAEVAANEADSHNVEGSSHEVNVYKDGKTIKKRRPNASQKNPFLTAIGTALDQVGAPDNDLETEVAPKVAGFVRKRKASVVVPVASDSCDDVNGSDASDHNYFDEESDGDDLVPAPPKATAQRRAATDRWEYADEPFFGSEKKPGSLWDQYKGLNVQGKGKQASAKLQQVYDSIEQVLTECQNYDEELTDALNDLSCAAEGAVMPMKASRVPKKFVKWSKILQDVKDAVDKGVQQSYKLQY
jgi:hypothetical protein